MNKFRTSVSILIMLLAAVVGFFAGAYLNDPFGCATVFTLIAGIACIIYVLDNREN